MKHKKIYFSVFLLCTILLVTGCSSFHLSTLFMNEEERNAYYHSSPSFYDQTLAADDSGALLELQNDTFWGKPYNNLSKFGDNILLIGEASYSSLLDSTFSNSGQDVQYEFSFDVYSPWYNRITASLAHTDISCTAYQVCGDYLFLLDSDTMTLARYDNSLNKIGEYDVSFFEDIDSLTFYPSGDDDTCFVAEDGSGELIQLCFSDSAISRTPVELPYYDLRVLYASPESHSITISGIRTSTLQDEIATFDTQTFAVTENYSIADASDNLFSSGTMFLPSGGFLLRSAEFTDDNIPASFTFSYYDAAGNGIAEFSYALDDYSAPEDASYLSQGAAFFEEESLAFFLIYNADCQPYLLVWDYSGGTAGMEPVAVPDAGESPDSATSSGEASYDDWGTLGDVRERADALEQRHAVKIRFGQDLPQQIGIYRVSGCSDESVLSEALDVLAQSLDSYPEGFFPQLCFGDTTEIIICLSDGISGDAEGMLDAPTGFIDSDEHSMMLVLSTEYLWDWDYTISHEISHMIDQRLEYRSVYEPDALFSEETWASYNPDGCTYLNTYEAYDENEQYELYSDYFADAYGMTFPTEDRAELFGLAMSDYLGSFDEDIFFRADTPTTEKYSYYCACIRDGFDTTGWAEVMPWEEILQ